MVSTNVFYVHRGCRVENPFIFKASACKLQLRERVLAGVELVRYRKHVYFHNIAHRGRHNWDMRINERRICLQVS